MRATSVRGPQLAISGGAGDNATRTPSRAQAIPAGTADFRYSFTAVHVDALSAMAGRFRELRRLSLYMMALNLRDRITQTVESDGAARPELFSFTDVGRCMSWTTYARDVTPELAAELRDAARVLWEGLSGMKGGFPFTRVEGR